VSERKFSVGQRVRIIGSPSPERIGQIASVISGPHTYENLGPWSEHATHADRFYKLDRLSHIDGRPIEYPARLLEPVYDGNELASWSDCAWKPKHLERA
jgi:hypothetical protein